MVRTFLLLFLLVYLPASVAVAADKNGWPTVSVVGGGYSVGQSSSFKAGVLTGIKLGYELNGRNVVERLGIEGVLQRVNGEVEADGSDADINIARLDILYLFNPPKSAAKLHPFLSVGGGLFWVDGDNVSASESSALIGYGGGCKFMFTDFLGVRADLRQILVFDNDTRSDYEYSLGMIYRFGVERAVPTKVELVDADLDGVDDSKDKCPETPQHFSVDKTGCPVNVPDSDSDGVPNYLDSCPDTPSGLSVDKSGCFLDDDGDGVPNERDRCPANPPGFQVDENGCTKLIRRSKG